MLDARHDAWDPRVTSMDSRLLTTLQAVSIYLHIRHRFRNIVPYLHVKSIPMIGRV
jgi:hypothetical protein